MSSGIKKAPAKAAAETVSDPFAATVTAQSPGGGLEIRKGFKLAKAREVLPHVSVYLHPKVVAKFKEIAAVEERKAHAVYLDALDEYLRKHHGVSLASLSEG